MLIVLGPICYTHLDSYWCFTAGTTSEMGNLIWFPHVSGKWVSGIVYIYIYIYNTPYRIRTTNLIYHEWKWRCWNSNQPPSAVRKYWFPTNFYLWATEGSWVNTGIAGQHFNSINIICLQIQIMQPEHPWIPVNWHTPRHIYDNTVNKCAGKTYYEGHF